MTIRIIEEPDIQITRAEIDRLLPEYQDSQRMTTRPVSFETWLRRRQDHHPTTMADWRPGN